MSKKSKKQSRARRVIHTNAKRSLPRPLSPPRSIYQSPSKALRLIEDRREFHPMGRFRPARSLSTPLHRLEVPNAPVRHTVRKTISAISHIAFKAPEKVLVCVRRQRRKEVLHALQKAGKSGQARPRHSYYSSIKCN